MSSREPTMTLEEIVAPMTAEQRYEKFLRHLHDRNMTVGELAALATKRPKSRAHVTQVLMGKRAGEHTWARLEDFLERDELIILGRKIKVLRGT